MVNHKDGTEKILMPTPNENKHVFKIEEDEEAKTYNLNEDYSDDDEYEEEEEETVDTKKESEKIGENSQTNPLPHIEKIKQESNPTTENLVFPDLSLEEDYDIHNVSHRIYYKGSFIDISDIITTKFIKRKSKGGLLSIFGFGNKKIIQENYIAFFDEQYLYFIKDVAVSKDQPHLRKVGNKYDIRLLQNTTIEVKNINTREIQMARIELR